MTVHNPNPVQNIYNAPTQPAYAIQSGHRTIPLGQGQGLVPGSAGMGGTGASPLGGAQNVNASGGVVASSGGRRGHGGSARVMGQNARGVSPGRNQSHGAGSGNENGNAGGASQHVSASGMQAQAQFQHRHNPVNHMTAQAQVQHQQNTANYVHPQAHNPQPHNPMNHIQPLFGGSFGPHAPHIPRRGGLLSQLSPYVPRTGNTRFSPRNLRGNRSANRPPMQLTGLPVSFGYPEIGNVNAGGIGMGMGFGDGGMVVNGWDSRWDGSGSFRGSAACPRGGRGRRRR
ncbi:uncharacterized protein EAE97_001845 [Botrytis byssoidea]|uniref:Uncharacterized protein n=1 Tax=Botrytis byssoidea TaxID=139641 RepID=A0A9P5IVZ9_9HELO|nr:uncharacterized protein EAE97_001845 [Botrytis byssoidea]KAF7952348.1 hypothetical protein EAE97_001845 [Botrytis byssoidea]